jgi:arylsulfatase A-like enzyme
MKFLLIFIDALRPDMLKVYDNSMPETALDEIFKNLGGTIFTKCYTPAPDTTRSTACLWSSKYPMANGCNTRMKWAKYCMNSPEYSLFYLLRQQGYSFNVFTGGRDNIESAALPPFFDEEYEKSI